MLLLGLNSLEWDVRVPDYPKDLS